MDAAQDEQGGGSVQAPVGTAHPEQSRESGAVERRLRAPIVLLWVLIIAYAAFFSAYTLQQHATLNDPAGGLSSIDQAIWNTVHGRLLKQTAGTAQVPRFAGRLELILLPLSLVYLVWDDVASLLILQSLALAIGALPVFNIARRTFAGITGVPGSGDRRRAEWLALAFALTYLLMPALQAANMAGFHTAALAVAPLLFAFQYSGEQRWRPMWGWALLAMATREDIALLTAALGLLLILGEGRGDRRKHGLGLLLASIGWYVAVAVLVVAPAAREAGLQDPWPGSGLADLARLWGPAWRDALGSLLRSTGWLALLAAGAAVSGHPCGGNSRSGRGDGAGRRAAGSRVRHRRDPRRAAAAALSRAPGALPIDAAGRQCDDHQRARRGLAAGLGRQQPDRSGVDAPGPAVSMAGNDGTPPHVGAAGRPGSRRCGRLRDAGTALPPGAPAEDLCLSGAGGRDARADRRDRGQRHRCP